MPLIVTEVYPTERRGCTIGGEAVRAGEGKSDSEAGRQANLRAEKFLDHSWKLIEKAREHVLRSESCEEYLARHDGSLEAGEAVVRRIVQDVRISFH